MTSAATDRPSLAPYPTYPLQHILSDTARRLPQKAAIIDGEYVYTYQQLDMYSSRFAVALAKLGVEKGDRVGLLAPNCVEFEIAFFGIIKVGAVVTTINSGYREREIAHQLDNSGAEVLVVHDSLLKMAEAARDDASSAAPSGETGSGPAPVSPASAAVPPPPVDEPRISFDDFMKVQLRVAKVIAAEAIPKSKKLLKVTVDDGAGERTLVAGIARAYAPETLVGRSVVIVANLEKAKLMGVESNGMILAATDPDGGPVLLGVDDPAAAPPGARVR